MQYCASDLGWADGSGLENRHSAAGQRRGQRGMAELIHDERASSDSVCVCPHVGVLLLA